MRITFRSDAHLGMYWMRKFKSCDLMTTDVRLMCEDSLSFELLCLSFDRSTIHDYARDALHFALASYHRHQLFWEFLISDTYNMQTLFCVDQVDLIMTCFLMLESLNHHDIGLPLICYDLTAARCVEMPMTPPTERFLRYADFVPIDFQLTATHALLADDEQLQLLAPECSQ